MNRLTVLYDATCPLCVRCSDWLATQRASVPLELLPVGSPEARRRYGAPDGTPPWAGEELVVIADSGEAWVGPAAFLVCLWALPAWRAWSYRLREPALAPLAERFFQVVSRRRDRLGAVIGPGRRGHGGIRRAPGAPLW